MVRALSSAMADPRSANSTPTNAQVAILMGIVGVDRFRPPGAPHRGSQSIFVKHIFCSLQNDGVFNRSSNAIHHHVPHIHAPPPQFLRFLLAPHRTLPNSCSKCFNSSGRRMSCCRQRPPHRVRIPDQHWPLSHRIPRPALPPLASFLPASRPATTSSSSRLPNAFCCLFRLSSEGGAMMLLDVSTQGVW